MLNFIGTQIPARKHCQCIEEKYNSIYFILSCLCNLKRNCNNCFDWENSLSSMIVRVNVVLKRTVGDSHKLLILLGSNHLLYQKNRKKKLSSEYFLLVCLEKM